MYKQYRDKVQFFIVYIREAHPSDGWQMRSNERDGVIFKQPKNLLERFTVANTCVRRLKFSLPCLIDNMQGTTDRAYSGWPDRFYVVDIAGKIAYKGRPGPRGFKPGDAEDALKKILANKGKVTKEQLVAAETQNQTRDPRRQRRRW